ncbi:hypothetical protein [Staphylococcus xylosus]|nr:hypothetical protein [Staphylococcus xylosus]
MTSEEVETLLKDIDVNVEDEADFYNDMILNNADIKSTINKQLKYEEC